MVVKGHINTYPFVLEGSNSGKLLFLKWVILSIAVIFGYSLRLMLFVKTFQFNGHI